MSSSSTNGLAKAKAAQTKASVNIAALAARNLGGFVPNKIFVGGVPIQSTEEQFKVYFERFGGISKVELHALRGFGYITYEQVQSVDDCLEKYEEHYLCRKWIEVKRSIPRELIESYEREQKRLEAEFKADGGEVTEESPSVKVETPSNAASSAPIWGMPPARGAAVGLPGPGVRWGAPPSAAAKAPQEPGGSAMTSQIQELTAMGFPEELARRVFRECAWDFNKALDRLLTSMDEEPAVATPPSVPSLAEDPPLSAAVATQPSPGSPSRKEATAWGKPAPTAWGKPAPATGPPETVWGAPKAATAWGKQAAPAPPPTNKAPPGTPTTKASTPKASGSPKAAAEAVLLPPAASPPPAPSSDAASGAAGYSAAAARPPVPEGGGDATTQPLATNASAPATPPSKLTPPSSVPPPPAALPPAAATASPPPPLEGPPPRTGTALSPGPASGQQFNSSGGSPKLKTEEIEPRIQQTESHMLPPSSQPPPPTEVKHSPVGEDYLEPTSKSDMLGAQEAVVAPQEPIAVAIAASLVADDEEEVVNGAEHSPDMTTTSESKGGLLDVTDGSAEGAPVGTPPRKRIQRMKRDWVAEDPSQLSANEGDFVSVWVETGTDHGWIHAERLTGLTDGVTQVGWLPLCVLHELPTNQRWMRTKQAWQGMGESQSNVEAEKLVVVWVDSRTAQGWTYVEASEDATSQPGWLPDFCIEWMDD